MQRYALKVYYDGRGFYGSQRQPRKRTVEGELLKGFRKAGIPCRDFQAAGRTDRGVSAAGNVFALSTDSKLRPPQINAVLPDDLWVTGSAEVPAGFNPRREALERTYRYYLFDEGFDLARVREAAAVFIGTHSFHNFTKEKGDSIRRITAVGVRKKHGFVVLTFRGQAFLWQQVRRMVTALAMAGRGEISAADIGAALDPEAKRIFRPAPPEPLVLWEVKYGFDFREDGYTVRRLRKHFTEAWLEASLLALQARELQKILK
jgi:tRNA pseudouridine38-40 synthase